MVRMYGFPDQATQPMSSKVSRNLFGAFLFSMILGVSISFYMYYRDLHKVLNSPGYGSLNNSNYLNGDILARRAALSHRQVRLRKESRGKFEGHMRFAESLVSGKGKSNKNPDE